MTVDQVFRTLWRRRALTLAGAVLTAAALIMVWSHQGVYSSQANVVFLAPSTAQKPNALVSTSTGLISMAGYVEQIVNAGVEKPATASNVTLLGRGVRDGYSIELPDAGGQWSHNFEQALLNVQVTGPTEDVVRARLDRLVRSIRTTTQDLQTSAHVSAKRIIRTDVTPTTPRVIHASGSRMRALGATLLLGVGLTIGTVVSVDRLAVRRRTAPGRRSASPAT